MKEKKVNPIISLLLLSFIALLVCFVDLKATFGAIDDSTIGKPATITGTVAVTSVSNIVAGHVQTNDMAYGYVASEVISVTTSTVTKIGTLTAGTKQIEIRVSDNVNTGGSWIQTGTGYKILSATDSPYLYNVSTTTPAMYFIGNATGATVTVDHIK